MNKIEQRVAFEVAYREAANQRKVYVHFDLDSAGEYKEVAVRLAFDVFQIAARASAPA